jgi:hypothetical protein
MITTIIKVKTNVIYLNLNIRNPKWWDRFENLWCKSGNTIWKNKFWEVQFMKNSELFRIELNWTVCQDHAGVRFELGLFGYQLDMSIHDSRHWDYKNNRWMNYGKSD